MGFSGGLMDVRRCLPVSAILLASAAVIAPLTATPVFAQERSAQEQTKNFNIPAQPLASALTAFGDQGDMQVTVDTDLVEGIRSPGVTGAMAPAVALSRLLAGSGLTWRSIGNRTVRLEPAPQASGDGTIQLGPVRVEGTDASGRGAYALRGQSQQSARERFAASRGAPTSITSVEATEIVRDGVRDLRDLSSSFSNVTAFDGGGNRMTQLSIRGVREQSYQTSPAVMPSVSYYVDDVPALTNLSRVTVFSNVDSVSLLKGPQIAGYGFSRPGGVVDIKTKEPENDWGGAILLVDMETTMPMRLKPVFQVQ